MNEKSIFCVDFDGTCVTHAFPDVGEDIGAAPILRKLIEHGHKIILFTMRSDDPERGRLVLSDAVDWFKKNDIPLYGININPQQRKWTSSPKAYGHVYIDDAALGIPLIYPAEGRPYVDWNVVDYRLGVIGYFD